MAQKNADPSKQQAEIIRQNNLDPRHFTVIKELNHSMIIKNRFTKEVRMIDKHQVNPAP